MSEKLASGTANLIHQDAAFRALKNEYGELTATALASKNLEKNGVDVPPEGIANWAKVNCAAIAGKLDIEGERIKAETLAAKAMGTAIENVSGQLTPEPELELEPEPEPEEEEPPSLQDMYGFDNEEDNDEAALDDVLKIQENC